MRDALPELRVQARIGVTTGEVVTGTEERLVTGDAVNTAARLEQAAPPGEILIGEPTLELVRDAVEAEPVEPLALKGKAEPVPAYRLVSLLHAPERSHGVALRRPRARARARPRELGAGALRGALRARHDRRRGGRGQVAPRGGGAGADRLPHRRRPLPSLRRGHHLLAAGRGGQAARRPSLRPGGGGVDPLAAGRERRGASAEEIAWAFRKLLEEQAPLVVLFDDIQWADETFLDLVEAAALLDSRCAAPPALHGAAGADRAPPLLARRRSGSSRSQPTRPRSCCRRRFDHDLRAADRPRRRRQPALPHRDGGDGREADGDVAVPATLRALLAARLDQLEPDERSVLERGAVEGEIFHRGAVQALSPDGQVTPRLAALVRKGLIRPDKAQLPGEDAFRFHHLLLRDAAYDALPKSVRADLHERFAGWLEQHGDAARRARRAARLSPRAGRPLPRRARPGQRRVGPGRRCPALRRGPARLLAG